MRRRRERVIRPGRRLRRAGWLVLSACAVGSAALSWRAIYRAVEATDLGQGSAVVHVHGIEVNVAAALFAGLLDGMILGSALLYVAGVKAQRPSGGWRGLAHTGVAGTVLANLASARSSGDIGWHVVAPAVWSLIVEFSARDILGDMRATRVHASDTIPWRLWISAPVEQARTLFRMLRTGEASAVDARLDADRRRAAQDALRLELPGRAHWSTRRQITRRLWAGTLDPAAVFEAIGWTGPGAAKRTPDEVLREALRACVPIESRAGEARPDRVEVDRVEASDPRIESRTRDRVEPDRIAAVEADRVEADRANRVPAEVDYDERLEPEQPVEPFTWIGSSRGADEPAAKVVALADHTSHRVEEAEGEARPEDVENLRAAIKQGKLPPHPSIEAVRQGLKISRIYARAALQAVQAEGEQRAARGLP